MKAKRDVLSIYLCLCRKRSLREKMSKQELKILKKLDKLGNWTPIPKLKN